MKPVDLRAATFVSVRQGLSQSFKDVYTAWVTFGPGTTREVSQKSGVDLLTLRPRTTDLYHLGLVELWGAERGSEGVYKSVPEEQWESWQKNQISGQLQML
jgi:hypothetical protein